MFKTERSLAFFVLLGIQECNSYYVGDQVTRMKVKIVNLDKELVLEAIRNVQRVDHIKEYYKMSTSYDIGELFYKMRSKFARMIRLYTLSTNYLGSYGHNRQILHLTEVQKIAMEIYNLVEVLQDWETSSAARKIKRPHLSKELIKSQLMNLPSNITLPSSPIQLRVGSLWSTKRSMIFHKNKSGKKIKNQESITKNPAIFQDGVAFDSDFY